MHVHAHERSRQCEEERMRERGVKEDTCNTAISTSQYLNEEILKKIESCHIHIYIIPLH